MKYLVRNMSDGQEPEIYAVDDDRRVEPGEILVDNFPKDPVWDGKTKKLREKTKQEKGEA